MDEYTSENTRKFLETYKQLEYLETIDPERVGRIKRANSQLFDTFRHIRNCLTHTPKNFSDDYCLHVSGFTLNTLESFIHQMVTKALEEGTKVEKLLVAKPSDDINLAIKNMDKYNYVNLPVLDEKGVVQYVVSNRAIISVLANIPATYEADRKYTISDFKDYFSLNANKDIYFDFMSKDAFAYDAKMKFIGYNSDHKRCSLIFITENGRKNEPILGIVSPSDVLDL